MNQCIYLDLHEHVPRQPLKIYCILKS